jgi:methylaspartate mutase epsilon subunit
VSTTTVIPSLGQYVAGHKAAGRLVVQPRMGFSAVERMREGLLAVKNAAPSTVGTITLDSYTRVNDHAQAARQLAEGATLNGYPIVAYGAAATRVLLEDVQDAGFPVQVRHGSADPREIFATMLAAGVDATEGGPISYCLPYSRRPLAEAMTAWRESAELLAEAQGTGRPVHMETFGGCLLGQLCPPSLLVAVSLLEGVFFRTHGLMSVSLSYAQQTNTGQDLEAVGALRRLAREFLPGVDWHVVIYTYMGLFPSTLDGAQALLDESVRMAVKSGAERLIVKTALEAIRIPTIEENVEALQRAADNALTVERPETEEDVDTPTYAEARALVDAVLDLDSDIDAALLKAFANGTLDIPFCLHPDNRNEARSVITEDGRLEWVDTGRMPLPEPRHAGDSLTAEGLLRALNYTASRYDNALDQGQAVPVLAGPGQLPGEST